jgi:signal transduction histidine kinase
MAHLQSALERFGHTADAAGVVRVLPILARLGELEKEALGGPRKDTVRSLLQALDRYREHLSADAAAFYGAKARELSPEVSAEHRPSPSGALTAGDLAELAPVLDRKVGGGAPWLERHPSLSGARRLDFVSFPHGPESAVHLLLDRDGYEAEARTLAAASGLEAERLRFASGGGLLGPFTTALPAPLANRMLDYSPPPGVLPEGFRGFQVISLAAFTWAVILLVVTILVGVLFTLRSVLREMRTARLKSDFVSFVSHELKTPLTAIRMFTETMLAGRVTDEEEKRFCIQMIDQESERLSKLVAQVLEYSRIEKHEKEFRFMSCDMEDVVREAVKLFKEHNRLDAREVEINAVQRISKIKMDRAAMIELLLNLLSNAAKYSGRDKKIVLNLRESIDDITVEVVDQGVGIRKRDQKKIFEKFYRAEDYLTREVEGTGLGLTFAKYIAKVHNGDIKVSSQLANGSTFTLQLRKSHVLAE